MKSLKLILLGLTSVLSSVASAGDDYAYKEFLKAAIFREANSMFTKIVDPRDMNGPQSYFSLGEIESYSLTEKPRLVSFHRLKQFQGVPVTVVDGKLYPMAHSLYGHNGYTGKMYYAAENGFDVILIDEFPGFSERLGKALVERHPLQGTLSKTKRINLFYSWIRENTLEDLEFLKAPKNANAFEFTRKLRTLFKAETRDKDILKSQKFTSAQEYKASVLRNSDPLFAGLKARSNYSQELEFILEMMAKTADEDFNLAMVRVERELTQEFASLLKQAHVQKQLKIIASEDPTLRFINPGCGATTKREGLAVQKK